MNAFNAQPLAGRSEKVNEQWRGLTPEDAEILARSFELPSVLLQADNIDARAMMAIEVHRERRWRRSGFKVTPAYCVKFAETNGETLREYLESQNGEVLA